MVSQEVVAYADVFRVRIGCRVNRQVDRIVVVLKNMNTRTPKYQSRQNATRTAEKVTPQSPLPLQRTRPRWRNFIEWPHPHTLRLPPIHISSWFLWGHNLRLREPPGLSLCPSGT